MKQALTYSLKVWLTAVTLGPVTIIILTKLIEPHFVVFDTISNVFGFLSLLIYLGFFASLPSWLLLWLTTFLLVKYTHIAVNNKTILSVVAVLLTVLPFYLIFGHDDNPKEEDLSIWSTSYVLVLVVGIWFYKLQRRKQDELKVDE